MNGTGRRIISVTSEQREELEALMRRPSAAAGLVKRARAILLLADGVSVSATGRLVGMLRRHLYKWIDRFRGQGVLGLPLVARERDPTSSGRVCTIPAQERERRARTAAVENARELDGAVYSGLAEFRIRYRPRIGTEAKDRGVLARKRLRERGAVREVRMLNLCQLWVRETELPAADRRPMSNAGVIQRIAKGVAADHSCRAHDHKTFLARRRSVHDSSRCSSQST